jgi:hypothetical protein
VLPVHKWTFIDEKHISTLIEAFRLKPEITVSIYVFSSFGKRRNPEPELLQERDGEEGGKTDERGKW